MTVGDPDQTLQGDHATASSGLPITFSTDTTDYCTIVSNKLHAVAAGTCVVHADQAGNAGWNAAEQADTGNITISSSGQAAAYFGLNEVGGSSWPPSGAIWMRNEGYTTGFGCPGTGTRTIDSLEVYASAGIEGRVVRVAVYNAANALICQHNGTVSTPDGDGPKWYGGATSLTGTCQCTGGTTYYLAWSVNGSSVTFYYNSSSGGSTYGSTDYTGGFPNPLADGTSDDTVWSVRGHVAAIP
jgi:hypothetical protein